MYMCVCVCMCVYVYICIYVCTYIYIYIIQATYCSTMGRSLIVIQFFISLKISWPLLCRIQCPFSNIET